ncbi:hypothetical protein IP91_02116 [Pseudoduganella lurida]|uniref:Uncharacterized protein n=1 Tax=Pseudoduganella lurida TaxID=1036180 RepID=A0A562RCL0_9BURK|nr:hypothetical protein [Pseudoduganella lurida]TWI66304.1 hypothetical protein IP91_02116 [Pseudoduganella lurida]
MDQCRLTPALPGCGVIAPPTVAEPVKPVQQARNEVIAALARDGQLLAANERSDADPAEQPQEGADAGGGAGGEEQTSGGPAAAAPTGTRNARPAVKNYCN